MYSAKPHYFKPSLDLLRLLNEYSKIKEDWDCANRLLQTGNSEQKSFARVRLAKADTAAREMELHVEVIDYRRKPKSKP